MWYSMRVIRWRTGKLCLKGSLSRLDYMHDKDNEASWNIYHRESSPWGVLLAANGNSGSYFCSKNHKGPSTLHKTADNRPSSQILWSYNTSSMVLPKMHFMAHMPHPIHSTVLSEDYWGRQYVPAWCCSLIPSSPHHQQAVTSKVYYFCQRGSKKNDLSGRMPKNESIEADPYPPQLVHSALPPY